MRKTDREAYGQLFDEAYREYLASLKQNSPEQYRKEIGEKRTVSPERFSFYLKTQSSFVAEEDSRIIGYVATQTIPYMRGHDKTLWIEYIVTKKEHRQQGVATALLEKLKEYAKQRRIDSIYATINPDNTASIKLHQKMGFNVKSWKVASLKLRP